MSSARTPRTPRPRLAAAVAAVLAVTAAGLATPAVAAPSDIHATAATAAAAAGQQDVPTVPESTAIFTSGPTGYLTVHFENGTQRVFTWTRYADGVRTTLPGNSYGGSPGTDIVVRISGTTYTYLDMSTGAEVASFDTSTLLGDTYRQITFVGTTFAATTSVNGVRELHLFRKEQGATVDRTVSGIPSDALYTRLESAGPDTLVAHYRVKVDGVYVSRVALVDVATATATEAYDTRLTDSRSVSAVSATHAAWIEWPSAGQAALAVVRRGTTDVTRTPLGTANSPTVKLVGDWVTYAQPGGGTAAYPDPLWPLTARSLSDPQRTVKLLDHVSNTTVGADGSLYATGGTVEQGEGIYRISVGTDGDPVVTKTADKDRSTALLVKDSATSPLPTVVDFARGQDATLLWEFSKAANFSVVITHNASGRRWTSERVHLDRPYLSGTTWTGLLDDKTSAPLGDYTWKLTAEPANGIGPSVERTGTLKVTAKPAPHDFTDSGTPDLLVRDSAGRIINYDARQTLYETGHWAIPAQPTQVVMGTGWQIYDRVVAPGNVDASPQADVIARDRGGLLWLYSGTGKGLAARKQIGTGWGIYRHLTGGSDLTGDGRADLLATDNTGALWLYKGTGNTNAPYEARKKVGTGWGIYNRITGTGNIAGGPAGDLVARDSAGVLWLYLGKGDGTFAPRVKIGSGWNRYTDIVGVGDTDRDGRPDLVVQGVMGGTYDTLALYKGTGNWKAPFGARTEVYSPAPLGTGAVTLF
ncbi:FG-GAP repeat domain-containing protein [Streptomyces sp. NPDC018711]|uniref:FG-GAP repeat domain-containing protein n=1 Tax=Streptomyces sp. NPDC018711 TaxID=3365052 RepID=UPI00379F3781